MARQIETQCCIAGGGPAGLMLGLLLARGGVDVVVLEKHPDFLRDFRGDTIHPSTMEVMAGLGLLDDFLRLPHQKVPTLSANFGPHRVTLADFTRLKVQAPFIAMMPQWDFLNFVAAQAAHYPNFRLKMPCAATGLVHNNGHVVGCMATDPEGAVMIRAPLVVAADGRDSLLRTASGLPVQDFGAPMDVLWFRLPRLATDTDQTQGRFDRGKVFVMLNRGDYWQCAFVIPKAGNDKVRAAGLGAFLAGLEPLLPFEPARANQISDWDQVKLLQVQVNRLKKWWLPGFLCIGDAAHAMSPVGGVGVNLAVQDAVATANILAGPLRAGTVGPGDLAAVQRRRDWPTRVIQRLQLFIQDRVISAALIGQTPAAPLVLRLLLAIPGLRSLPARLIGLGVRPELPMPQEIVGSPASVVKAP